MPCLAGGDLRGALSEWQVVRRCGGSAGMTRPAPTAHHRGMTEADFDPDDDAAVRRMLLARRADLQALMDGSREARQAVELDQTKVGRLSRMDAIQGQAMALETDRRRALELQRIDSALKRLDAGEYGLCVRCGEEIPARRLGFDPAATVCIDCAAG